MDTVIGQLQVDDGGSVLTSLKVVKCIEVDYPFSNSLIDKVNMDEAVFRDRDNLKDPVFENGSLKFTSSGGGYGEYLELPKEYKAIFSRLYSWGLGFEFLISEAINGSHIFDFAGGLRLTVAENSGVYSLICYYQPINIEDNQEKFEGVIEYKGVGLNKWYRMSLEYNAESKEITPTFTEIEGGSSLPIYRIKFKEGGSGKNNNALDNCLVGSRSYKDIVAKRVPSMLFKSFSFGRVSPFSDYFTLDLDGTIKQHTKVPEEFGTQVFQVKATNGAGEVEEIFELYIASVNDKDLLGDGSEIAFYKFDDNTNDEYSNYNLTAKSGTSYESGISNNGIATSSDSYAWVKNQDFMKNVQKYLSVWVKNKQNGDNSIIVHTHQADAGWGNFTIILKQGKVKVGGRNGNHSNTSWSWIYESNALLNNTDWYHIVLNKKDNTTYELYINGQLDGTFDFTFYEPNSYMQVIGASLNENEQPYSDNSYNVVIDNLRVFNRPLTQEEVQTIYDIEKPQ